MNDSMKEYIHLKKQFQEQEKDLSSVLAFYEFADRRLYWKLQKPSRSWWMFTKSWACMLVPFPSS